MRMLDSAINGPDILRVAPPEGSVPARSCAATGRAGPGGAGGCWRRGRSCADASSKSSAPAGPAQDPAKPAKPRAVDWRGSWLSRPTCERLALTLEAPVCSVDCTRSRLDAGGLAALGPALAPLQLTTLELGENALGPQAAEPLAFMLRTLRVEHLGLAGTQLGAGLEALVAALEAHAVVTSLNLAKNALGPSSGSLLGRLLASPHLKRLGLGHNRLGKGGLEALAQAAGGGGLTALDLANNALGPQSGPALQALVTALPLEELELGDNCIQAPGCALLAAALPGSDLRTLGLNRNAVGDEGVRALAAALPRSRLSALGLSFNAVSASGLEHLEDPGRLEELDLSGNPALRADKCCEPHCAAAALGQMLKPGNALRKLVLGKLQLREELLPLLQGLEVAARTNPQLEYVHWSAIVPKATGLEACMLRLSKQLRHNRRQRQGRQLFLVWHRRHPACGTAHVRSHIMSWL